MMKRTALGLCVLAMLAWSAQTTSASEGVSANASTNVIKDYGLRKYDHLSKDLPHSETNTWRLVCTIPYNCHFQLWIQLESPEGKVIQFNSSNPLVTYLTPTESATTREGDQTIEAQKWISGEGAIYTIPAGVTVKAVQYRETGYDTAFAGSFQCNDNDYNILWKKGARTVYLCMRDHFYDCPDRERVGFWGDGTPELNQCFYIFDAASHQLCKELVLRKLEPKFYPGQHLEFLGEYGLWFYYLQTGDLESIRAVYDQTKTFLFDTYQSGNRKTWFDWGSKDKTDTAVVETCFMYIDLQALRKMAVATGHTADTAAIDHRLAAIKDTFDSKYWNGNFYMSTDVTTPDDHANAMAINAGLADSSKWNSIYTNVLAQVTHSSNFFDRWIFEALCTMGRQDSALLRMYERYETMIPCSFTTLWEVYNRWWLTENRFEVGSSLNHGWNYPPLVLSQTIAGVSPEAPGWTRYHVLPKEAFLTAIKVVVPSIKGNITVDMRKTASEYALNLTSPPNTTAVVGIPKGAFSKLNSIKVNETTVWDGTYHDGVPGVTWNGEDAGYVKFNVAPGTWKVTGLGSLPMTSPKPPPPPPPNDTALEKNGWVASASVPDGVWMFNGAPLGVSAANAIDGDHWTGWRDMTATNQYPGQWFQVDIRTPQTFDKIVIDNTWALWDSPDKYAVTVSNDGTNWGDPIATGSGHLGMTTITFPPQTARYLRVTQTGANALYRWSIFELDVYRRLTQ